MLELCEIKYSHVECISAIRGVLQLSELYLKESDVIELLAEGWPDIITLTMGGLGKTEEPNSDTHRIQATIYCYFANWQNIGRLLSRNPSQAEDRRVVTESASLFEVIPSHDISLTDSGRDNPIFLIDTELHCSKAKWRGECIAWAVSEFFEVLKDHFLQLQFILINYWLVVDAYTTLGLDCLNAVQKAADKHYHVAADRLSR
ncbi:hypothetical protein BBK36DRAFT_1168160 [Trichoderma citrinoviride]|uniref:Uncharacterized protein n=1 Tax=Trichoderma citrinoviride TaxID=58853 RepID=A0A2T4BBM0_9HYPO|nr:hypothetical protein BBK36DRAFT_1168160 [Trichoderma citrinoviride]PTB66621.1 hypothetical protein BBK36DRAFT_1168160 [Trichoderma citrinoviride]